jgi:hypothetical protein
MRYEIVAVDENPTRPECLVTVREQPNWLERQLGKSAEQWSAYGREDGWRRTDGARLTPAVLKELCRLWDKHQRKLEASDHCRSVRCAESMDVIDETVEESFPASDPPAWTSSSI